MTNPMPPLAPTRIIEDPPIARALFGDTRWAWIWLVLRLYVIVSQGVVYEPAGLIG